jgi:hypothetical protein
MFIMGIKLNFYIGFIVIFVIFNTLSLLQRLLVITGGILGGAIYNFLLGAYKKPTGNRGYVVDFSHERLVSIHDDEPGCIFPKDKRCAKHVANVNIPRFDTYRKGAFFCKAEALPRHLRYMIPLKFCSGCKADGDRMERCLNGYVEKWSFELAEMWSAQAKRDPQNNEYTSILLESNTTNDLCSDELPPREAEIERNPPGAYPDAIEPELALSTSPRSKRSPSEQHTAFKPKVQSESIASDDPVHNSLHPAWNDSLSQDPQQFTYRITISPPHESPPAIGGPTPATPALLTYGWRLLTYNSNEILHTSIIRPLQKMEIRSGSIYILRRPDDEEYYKVGYTEGTAEARLIEWNEKCNGTWEIAWSTPEQTKHAKRVEKLIHLECEARGIRCREKYCKTGTESSCRCQAQHREIVKAPFEEVLSCVKHWVDWMKCGDRYVKTLDHQQTAGKRRASNGTEPAPIWSLASCHSAKIHSVGANGLMDEFCLMSTGATWVKNSPMEQKNNGRRKSTGDMPTPERPIMLQNTRETQSARPLTRHKPSFDTQDSLRVPTPLQLPSASTKSRRGMKSVEARRDVREDAQDEVREDEIPDGISQDDASITERINREATPRTPLAVPASSMDAQPRRRIKRPDAIASSEPDDSPAIPNSMKQRCGTCSKQKSNLRRLCTACLTPEPDDEDPFVSCEGRSAKNLGAIAGRRL